MIALYPCWGLVIHHKDFNKMNELTGRYIPGRIYTSSVRSSEKDRERFLLPWKVLMNGTTQDPNALEVILAEIFQRWYSSVSFRFCAQQSQ